MTKHDPEITVGRRWGCHPACSCGWIGPHCDNEGEAKRRAATHVTNAQALESANETLANASRSNGR